MSVTLLAALVFLVGLVTYLISKRLVTTARWVAACLSMASLAGFIAIVQNREAISRQWNFSATFRLPFFSGDRTASGKNSSHDPGSANDVVSQSVSTGDRNFLDEILKKQNQDVQKQGDPADPQVRNIGKTGIVGSGNESALKAELAVNTADLEHSAPIPHQETVKRAQLVTHQETLKRAELVRSRRQ